MSAIKQTPDEIANAICMSHDDIVFIIVEGVSDEKFFRNRPFYKAHDILVAFGWEKLEEIVSIIKARKQEKRIIGVIDRDYRDYISYYTDPRIVLTDYHSIESLMFWSDAFTRVITEHGSKEKIGANYGTLNKLRDKIATVSAQLGKLRIHCQQNKLNIKFKGIKHKDFIDSSTFSLDKEKTVKSIFDVNEQKIKKTDLLSCLDDANRQKFDEKLNDKKLLCHGHDLMDLTACALRKTCGTHNAKFDGEYLESLFRLAFSDEMLNRTEMWTQMIRLMETCTMN